MKPVLAAILSSTALFATGLAQAQTAAPEADKAAALGVVTAFFDAMRAHDGAALTRLVQPGSQLSKVEPGPDGPAAASAAMEPFIAKVQAAPGLFIERIWDPTVLVDGGVAVVWARYDFHLGSTFSHNGRDVFVLLKTQAGWKIASVVYSVEPGGRSENPAGPPKP